MQCNVLDPPLHDCGIHFYLCASSGSNIFVVFGNLNDFALGSHPLSMDIIGLSWDLFGCCC